MQECTQCSNMVDDDQDFCSVDCLYEYLDELTEMVIKSRTQN